MVVLGIADACLSSILVARFIPSQGPAGGSPVEAGGRGVVVAVCIVRGADVDGRSVVVTIRLVVNIDGLIVPVVYTPYAKGLGHSVGRLPVLPHTLHTQFRRTLTSIDRFIAKII
jgi:hypothetical protein